MNQETINSIYSLLPELTLALCVLTLTIVSSFRKKADNLIFYLTGGFLALSALFVTFQFYFAPQLLFNGLIVSDNFGAFVKILISVSILIIFVTFRTDSKDFQNNIFLVTFLIASLMAVSSANLVLTFVSIEIMGIVSYMLLSANKGLSFKFYIYSVLFSGVMLYGISLLYGLTGSADYYSISVFLSNNPVNELTLAISVIMIITGFAFKMMLLPFNFVLPSLSEKMPLKSCSLIGLILPIAAGASLIRFLLTAFHDGGFITDTSSFQLVEFADWQNMIILISVFSVLSGGTILLWQTKIRKILAFNIIFQSGFMLLPLCSTSKLSVAVIFLYTITFLINNLALLMCINLISGKENIELKGLKGLGRKYPVLGLGFILFLISSAGVPLTLGFISKLYIYSLVFTAGYGWAGVITILSSAVFLYFIYKVVYILFSSGESDVSIKFETFDKVLMLLLLFSSIIFGIYSQPLLDFCKYLSNIYGI